MNKKQSIYVICSKPHWSLTTLIGIINLPYRHRVRLMFFSGILGKKKQTGNSSAKRRANDCRRMKSWEAEGLLNNSSLDKERT